MLNSNKGQAMVEFLPGVVIFMLIMSAGLAYFRVMRAAAIREEAARNLAFAKMDNVGTLTSLKTTDALKLTIEGSTDLPTISGQDNSPLTKSTTCFTVFPALNGSQSNGASLTVPIVYRRGVASDSAVNVTTYAVVCRKNSSSP